MPDFGIRVQDKNKKKRETNTTVLFLRRAALELREHHKTSLITPPACTHGALFF